MAQQAILFDGETAIERIVRVEASNGQLIVHFDGASEAIDPAQLVKLYAVPGQLRIGRCETDGWRLVFHGEIEPDIVTLLPARFGSVAPRLNRRAAAISGAATAVLAGLIGSLFVAPQLAARQVPLALERWIGDSVKLPPNVVRCENPAALSALEKIVDRLDPEARADGFTVELLDVQAINAAALPGGRIVVLNGLIDEAGNADAIAGVLAHEIAHVRRRHVASQAIRQLGVASLISVMGGGDLSATAGGLLELKFSRDAEAEADADAVTMLERAGINPRPTAYLFDKLHKSDGGAPEWLSSHPASDARARAFTASYHKDGHYRPTLSEVEENTLFDGCQPAFFRFGEQTASQ